MEALLLPLLVIICILSVLYDPPQKKGGIVK